MAMLVLQTPLLRGGTAYTGATPTAADQKTSRSYYYRELSGILERGTATSTDRTYTVTRTIVHGGSQIPNESHYLFMRYTELDTDTYARDLWWNPRNPDSAFLMHYRVGSRTFGMVPSRFIRVLNDTWVYNQRLPAGAFLSFRFFVTFRNADPLVSRFRLLPNRRPVVANRSVATNSAAITINLNDVYRNENANTQFAVNTSSSGICQAAISGRTLTLTPGSTVGTATITLIGWGAGQVEELGSFTVRTFRQATTNPAPTRVGTIPNASAQVSTAAQRVNVSSYFRDTDTLTYSAASSNTNVVTTSVSGSTVTLTPGSTVGTSTITVTATDTASQTVNQTFTFTTSAAPPVNPVPARVGTIPNRTADTGSAAHTLNVSPYFTDTDTLTYSAVSSSTGVVSVSVSGSVVTMTPGSTAGASTITVTATDTASQSVTQTFTFTTSHPSMPANPAPTRVGTIPNQTQQVDSLSLRFGASFFFNDTDTLTYTAVSSNTSVATVTGPTGNFAIFQVSTGSTTGTATITVTATDTANQSITQTFTVTATSAATPNPAPTRVGTISNRSVQVSTSASTLNIASYFTDTDTLTYGVASSNTNVVAVSVSGSTITMTPGSTAGSSTITVTATDTASQSVTQTFTFTTTSAPVVNPAPTRVGTIPNRNVQVGAGSQRLTVSSYFSDTDALTYAAGSSNTSVVSVSVSGAVLTMTAGETAGASTITVTATDTASQSISQTFTFITTARPIANPPPQQVGTIPRQTWQAGTGPHALAAADYFLDTDAITYAISTSHGTIATATINETTGAAAITAVAAGTATITITATDTANQTATQAFIVTVTAAEAPAPEATVTAASVAAQIPDQTIEVAEDTFVDMRPYFNDADAYEVTSRDVSVVEVGQGFGRDADGNELRGVRLIGTSFDSDVGTAEVVVNAYNWASFIDAFRRGVPAESLYATQTFNVTVVRATRPFVDRRTTDFAGYIRSDDPPLVISNPRKFFQWQGTGTLTAASSNTDVATVAYDATANTLTITPVKGGYVSVAITLTYPLAPSGGIGAAGQQSPTTGTETFSFTTQVADAPQARQAYREPFLICVDIGGDVDLHVCSYPDDVTIGGQTYIGLGNFMGIVPVTATGERDNRGAMEVRMIVDDTVAGVADAINAVGGPPVTISIYNEKGDALPAVPTAAPGIPAGLRASDTAYNAITYAWGAVNNAAGYDLYVSTSRTDPDDDTAPTASIGNVLLYRVTGLAQNTQQYAWIRSRNAAGVSDWSSRVDTMTPRIPLPSGITGFMISRGTGFGVQNIDFRWNPAERATLGYEVRRWILHVDRGFSLRSVHPTRNASLDLTLQDNAASYYSVRARNESGYGPETSRMPWPRR